MQIRAQEHGASNAFALTYPEQSYTRIPSERSSSLSSTLVTRCRTLATEKTLATYLFQ